jgi:hypothetical protein
MIINLAKNNWNFEITKFDNIFTMDGQSVLDIVLSATGKRIFVVVLCVGEAEHIHLHVSCVFIHTFIHTTDTARHKYSMFLFYCTIYARTKLLYKAHGYQHYIMLYVKIWSTLWYDAYNTEMKIMFILHDD